MKKNIVMLSVAICIAVSIGIYAAGGIDKAVTAGLQLSAAGDTTEQTAYGQLYLQVSGISQNNTPKILINGVTTGYIDTYKLIVNVRHGDVVEIDGRGCGSPIFVQITGSSANVLGNFAGRWVNVEGDIQNVGTFSLK